MYCNIFLILSGMIIIWISCRSLLSAFLDVETNFAADIGHYIVTVSNSTPLKNTTLFISIKFQTPKTLIPTITVCTIYCTKSSVYYAYSMLVLKCFSFFWRSSHRKWPGPRIVEVIGNIVSFKHIPGSIRGAFNTIVKYIYYFERWKRTGGYPKQKF